MPLMPLPDYFDMDKEARVCRNVVKSLDKLRKYKLRKRKLKFSREFKHLESMLKFTQKELHLSADLRAMLTATKEAHVAYKLNAAELHPSEEFSKMLQAARKATCAYKKSMIDYGLWTKSADSDSD